MHWNMRCKQANNLDMGVVVAFGLTDDYPEANLRHYTFMLEGLAETNALLEKRGIHMVVRRGSPPDVALELGQNAAMIVCDRGYLKHQRIWRDRVARKSRLPCRSGGIRRDCSSGDGLLESRICRPNYSAQDTKAS